MIAKNFKDIILGTKKSSYVSTSGWIKGLLVTRKMCAFKTLQVLVSDDLTFEEHSTGSVETLKVGWILGTKILEYWN